MKYKKELKSKTVTVFLTPEVYEQIRKAAYIDGRDISPFLCFSGYKYAKRIIKKYEEENKNGC